MQAFYAFVVQGFRQQSAYRADAWLGMASSLIWFMLYVGIWRAVLRGDSDALNRQMAYVIISRGLSELHFVPVWEVANRFRQGDVGLDLLKPLALPIRFVADFFGRSLFRLLRAVPAFALIWWAFGLDLPGTDQALLLPITALLGYVITVSLNLAISLIALWTVQFNQAQTIYWTIANLLSGAFIPLHFLPDGVRSVAAYLPFAGVYYVPSAAFSGSLTGAALAQALTLQATWAAASVLILYAVWTAGSRRLVMQGG